MPTPTPSVRPAVGSWAAMLSVCLLMVAATRECSARSRESAGGQLESRVLSAMKEVNRALEHYDNMTQKSLKFHKQNSDVLHQTLRIIRQNGEVLSSLWRLPSNVKEELREQNSNVFELVKNATHSVERLTRENEGLKIHLANKESKVQELEEVLEEAKEENEQFNLRLQDLEINLEETVREVEELRQREKNLNRTVSTQSKLLEDIHPLVVQHNVTKLVNEYNSSKSWKALRKGLEAVLDSDSTPYKQVRNISYDDESPLWTIAFHGYSELVTVLLYGRQDPDVTDGEGCTLLHGAAQGGHVQLARTLLNRGADSEARGGRTHWTPLVYAARWGHLHVAKLLKERGVDLNASTEDGETALHWAAWEGHLDVVKYLVSSGASTTARNYWGRTALENAKLHGQTAVVECLSQFPH